MIQVTTVVIRAKNVLVLAGQSEGDTPYDTTPINLISLVLGSIQARGPRERQIKIKLVFTLAIRAAEILWDFGVKLHH